MEVRTNRKLKRTDSEVTDVAGDSEIVNVPDNPLDKSDSVNSAREERRRHAYFKRNILASTASTENNKSLRDSFPAVTDEDAESIGRSSGFLEVNNSPYQGEGNPTEDANVISGASGVDNDESVGSALTHLSELLKSKSKDEKIKTFRAIKDEYQTLKKVSQGMKDAGVTQCCLILGIDYTLSNKIQGQRTFGGRSLHDLSPDVVNPYKETICILGETLEEFKPADAEIPVFAIGRQLSLLTSETKCMDFGGVLDLYEDYTPTVKLGGPTNFAPIIYESIKIVERTKKFHILLIIADGQVIKEEETIAAIIEASNYALSIVVVGVGDGPWGVMQEFDDKIPDRKFDNFQFVEFHSIKENAKNPETEVALMALMEIPQQYKCITAMQLLDFDDELNETTCT